MRYADDAVVLSLRGRPGCRVHGKRSKHIALPALAWRVVVEAGGSGGLHALQRAALGMVGCGVDEPGMIADLLCLDQALVDTLLDELKARRLVDNTWKMTRKGRDQLEDRDGQPRAITVFTDSDDGAVWPRFGRSLQAAQLVDTDQEARYPGIDVGTPGRPWTIRPHYVSWPRTPSDHAPSGADVRLAIKRHVRALRDQDDTLADFRQVGRLHAISPHPEPVFLVTEAYIPADEALEERWRSVDPFADGGDLPWLRRRLDALRRRDEHLQRAIGSLYPAGSEAPGQAALELRVEERLSARVADFPDVLDALCDMEASTRRLRDDALDVHSTRRERRSFAAHIGPLFESALAALTESCPVPPEMQARLSLQTTAEALREAAEQLSQTMLPGGWAQLTSTAAKKRALKPSTIDEHLQHTVLSVASRQTHPLRASLLQQSSLLGDLHAARDFRNRHLHKKVGRKRWSHDDVARHLAATYALLEAALPHMAMED